MYKLLALDMDGTLLNTNKIVTPPVRQAIQSLVGRGVNVTIASGRFPASVWLHGKHVGSNCSLVAFNGAVILDEETGEIIQGFPIQPTAARRLAALAAETGAYVHFCGYRELYVEQFNEWNVKWPLSNAVIDPEKELTSENYKDHIGGIQVKEVGSLVKFTEAASQPIYKAAIICDDSQLLNQLYNEIDSWQAFTLTKTGKRRFDINAAGVSKKSALEAVCRTYGISSAEVVAIGDYDNDVEMLQWAGLGVAMSNGSNEAKQAAKAETTSNNEDGVAEAIARYF